jgi:uncharacterized membrane protein YqgA involved in biofilm formation
MTGTLINAGAIIAGSVIGLIFHAKISKKYIKIVFQAIGLFTFFIGIDMALKTQNYLLMVFSLVLGAIIGTFLKLDKKINEFGDFVKGKIKSDNSKFSEGLITAFLLYCMGSLTILGAFEEGLGNPPNLLLAKSLMDGVSAITLSAALGTGVIFSIIPLIIYQGGLMLFARMLSNKLSDLIIDEISAVGGILLIGMALNILEITKIKIINMVPALLIIVVLVYFFA